MLRSSAASLIATSRVSLRRSLSTQQAPTIKGKWIDDSQQVYQQFSDNDFVMSSALPCLDVINPATQTVVGSIAETTQEEFNDMADKAQTAFSFWKTVPVQQRQRVMLEYQRLIRLATPELAELITLEQGKTIADAKGDVFRGLEVVETACQVAPYLLGDSLAGISSSMVRGPCMDTHKYKQQTNTVFPHTTHILSLSLSRSAGHGFISRTTRCMCRYLSL